MKQPDRRGRRGFRPWAERVEPRLLLRVTFPLPAPLRAALHVTPGFPAERPNRPVLPFGSANDVATFIDPTAKIVNGAHVLVGFRSFIAPFALINATSGFVKIGSSSSVQDNAVIQTNPDHLLSPPSIFIGDAVTIGAGAIVRGPSKIGAYAAAFQPTAIGPNALIDGATIEPGAIVGALARVGPGVTVPTGFRVLPGKNVTTDAEASEPALGKVVKVTPIDVAQVAQFVDDNALLALGYATLYQGDKATGPSLGVAPDVSGVFNGSLAAVEGSSREAGAPTVPFEPTTGLTPKYLSAHNGLVAGRFFDFPARITGQASFSARARQVAHRLGHHNAIRADQGQPFKFASFLETGNSVTVHAPVQGQLQVGTGVQVGPGAVILAGETAHETDKTILDDNVTIGPGAVIERSTIGANASIGARSFIADSKVPAGAVIPPGTILVKNVVVGSIEW